MPLNRADCARLPQRDASNVFVARRTSSGGCAQGAALRALSPTTHTSEQLLRVVVDGAVCI